MAEAGSDLAGGHGFRAGFFLPAHAVESAGVVCSASVCCDDGAGWTVTVEVEEDVDAIEEDELLRWTPFRGMNMRDTSSPPMPLTFPGLA